MISVFIGSRILATSRDFWMMILKDDLCVFVLVKFILDLIQHCKSDPVTDIKL